jgi:hypothetical protein
VTDKTVHRCSSSAEDDALSSRSAQFSVRSAQSSPGGHARLALTRA